MSWPGWNRTSVVSWFKAMAPLPTEQPAIRPLGRSRTGCLAGTSWPLFQVSYKGIVSSVRFERTLPTASGGASYRFGLRGRGASGRTRTACLSLTKGPLCLLSYRGVAAHRGFEPRSPGSGPGILPLNERASSAEGAIRTRRLRILSSGEVSLIAVNP